MTKADRHVEGVSTAKNMGDILFDREVTERLGPDLRLHLQALYADPRGWNLRNELAHGLMPAERMSEGVVLWVIHTLLVFGLWGQLSKQNKTAGPAGQR